MERKRLGEPPLRQRLRESLITGIDDSAQKLISGDVYRKAVRFHVSLPATACPNGYCRRAVYHHHDSHQRRFTRNHRATARRLRRSDHTLRRAGVLWRATRRTATSSLIGLRRMSALHLHMTMVYNKGDSHAVSDDQWIGGCTK